jgi:hypothetical protein
MKTHRRPVPSNFGSLTATARAEASVRGMRVAAFAEDSPFASLRGMPGYQSDDWKAFVEYDVCHALPTAVLGPVPMGPIADNHIGFFGDTLAQSHQSLINQQMNYRHWKDNVIGTVLATAMPPKPPEGWYSPANPAGAKTAHIKALAVVWKVAHGMEDILAAHLDSTQPQSVSIEVITNLGNLGVWRGSTNQMAGMDAIPPDWLRAMEFQDGSPLPFVGRLDGEQLVCVYGAGGAPVQFYACAITPKPAEKFAGTDIPAAKITAVAEKSGGGEMYAVCAEAIPGTLRGTRLKFESGKTGIIRGVRTSGLCAGHRASQADPLVQIALGRGTVELALSAVRKRLRHV